MQFLPSQSGGVRLIIPYLIWSLVYESISIVRGNSIELFTIVKHLLIGKAASPFYYIVVLVQLTLLTPLLIKISGKYKQIIWYMTPIMLCVVYYTTMQKQSTPWWCDTLFPLWIGFYYLGLCSKENENGLFSCFLKFVGKVPFVCFAFIVNLCESILLINIGAPFSISVSQNRIGGFLYAIAIIGFIYRHYNHEVKEGFLVKIGDDSYGIYLVHYLFIIASSLLTRKLFVEEQWVIRFIVAFIFTVVGSFAFVEIIKYITRRLKIERTLKYIGFE